MIDPQTLRPGDMLIGFSKHGPAIVVSNKPSFNGMCELNLQIGESTHLTAYVAELAEHVRVLKSVW